MDSRGDEAKLRRAVNRGYTPALGVERAADRSPRRWLRLDRPLDAYPEVGVQLDYATLARLVRQAAGSLAEAGVARGQRVAIVKRNHVDIYLLACASARLGAVPALISSRIDPISLADMLARLEPSALVTDSATSTSGSLSETERARLPETVLAVDGSPDGASPLPPASEHVPPLAEPRSLDDAVLITHTSGTTGVPKLVVQSLRAFSEIVAVSVTMPRLLRLSETVGVHLSFSHWRSLTGATGMLLSGFPAVVLSDDHPDLAGSMFEEHRPGLIESHPNSLVRWQELAARGGAFDNVRFFSSTFDAIHPRTIEQLVNSSKRRNVMYLQTYGQSETGPITFRPYTCRSLKHADGRCVGFALPKFSKFRIRPVGELQAKRSQGLIEASSPGRSSTYLGQEADYQAKLSDGWWNMTDIGYKSRWGCLHLLDREVDQSENVPSLLEIEDTLLKELPELAEVVLIPTGDGPPVPIVCTQHDRPFDGGAWRHATAELPSLAEPLHVRWSAVPRTATSKVRRFEARELLATNELELIP